MPRIPRAIIDEMVAHAREDLPNEACGMVHAKDGVPPLGGSRDAHPPKLVVHRVGNLAASPYRYEMNPLQMMKLERRRDDEGETLFAIYHSHVASAARPSPTDVRMAFYPPDSTDKPPMYPETYYILVSLEHEEADVRAYHIRQGGIIEEAPIEVV